MGLVLSLSEHHSRLSITMVLTVPGIVDRGVLTGQASIVEGFAFEPLGIVDRAKFAHCLPAELIPAHLTLAGSCQEQ